MNSSQFLPRPVNATTVGPPYDIEQWNALTSKEAKVHEALRALRKGRGRASRPRALSVGKNVCFF